MRSSGKPAASWPSCRGGERPGTRSTPLALAPSARAVWSHFSRTGSGGWSTPPGGHGRAAIRRADGYARGIAWAKRAGRWCAIDRRGRMVPSIACTDTLPLDLDLGRGNLSCRVEPQLVDECAVGGPRKMVAVVEVMVVANVRHRAFSFCRYAHFYPLSLAEDNDKVGETIATSSRWFGRVFRLNNGE